MNYCTPKDIQAIQKPLGMDIDGDPWKETDNWIYAATVGIIHYLSRNLQTDI